MARSQTEIEFGKFITQNQEMLMASRGAKSQFSEIDLPTGEFYCQLLSTSVSTFDMDQRDSDGNSTGMKVRTGRIQIKLVVVASADPRCASVEEMRTYAGKQEFINLILPPGDQAAFDRCMATLGAIGIPTEQFVPTERDIKDPNCQMTLEQGLAMIDDSKPYCKVAVTESKGRKYLNYRAAIDQAQLEALIGTSLGDADVPFESEPEATDEIEWQWSEEYQAWNAPGTDDWFDKEGTPIESPVPPAAPVTPVRRPPARQATPAVASRGTATTSSAARSVVTSNVRPGTAPGIGSRRVPPPRK